MSFQVYTDFKRRIWIAPKGHIDEQTAVAMGQAITAAMADRTHPVVFDARLVEGYSAGARSAWQKALFPLRKQMEHIYLIGGNAIVRMGATMVCAFIGVRLTLHKDASEIDGSGVFKSRRPPAHPQP